jgi:hypothetical protein
MSTQAAPARNSPEAAGSSGAGSLPDIPAHPAKMEKARIDATDTVIENFMMLLIRKESPGRSLNRVRRPGFTALGECLL